MTPSPLWAGLPGQITSSKDASESQESHDALWPERILCCIMGGRWSPNSDQALGGEWRHEAPKQHGRSSEETDSWRAKWIKNIPLKHPCQKIQKKKKMLAVSRVSH